MLKRIIALSVVTLMMTAVITPVAIAADLDFSGELSSQFGYYKVDDDATEPTLHGDSEFSLTASLGEKVKAGFSIDEMERLFDGQWNSGDNKLGLNNIWLEAQGSIIPGAPEMTTRIGGLDVNYSPYVAHEITNNGISIDGLNLGPVSMGGFYSWNHTRQTQDKGAFVKVVPVEGIEVKGTVVQTDEDLSYAVEGKTAPIENLEVTGGLAVDQEKNQAYQVNGKYQLLENLEIRGGYRDIPVAYQPAYSDIKLDAEAADEKGFSVGATTTQLGVELSGDYALYNNTLGFSAARGFELAAMNFDTKLEGEYDVEGAKMTTLDASVGYNAPNGLAISAGYDFINKQPEATVGLSVQF